MTAESSAPPAAVRVDRALHTLARGARPEAWIALRGSDELRAEAESVDARVAAGERLPLAGWTVAVKDNIDVAGLPTTAGCPAFSFEPSVDAPAVARLRRAGAIVLGKTSLDQFATGLVGTRSPFGEVRDVRDPALVSGGSSSGSAVAVALGIADIALATDTAGSGRVPAAFQGIVGLKPTVGLVPVDGVVPACQSFDCVSVLSRELGPAVRALELIADPVRPADAPLAYGPDVRLATFDAAVLCGCSSGYAAAFAETVERLRDAGASVEEIDPADFLAAGALLYDGAFVAERYAAVGTFIRDHPGEVDPAVAEIVMQAQGVTAAAYIADRQALGIRRRSALAQLRAYDALLLPTAPWQPTIDAVRAEPIEVNRALGTYVTFCNLLGLCAAAVPAGTDLAGRQFGVSLYAPPFHDLALSHLVGRLAQVLNRGGGAGAGNTAVAGAAARAGSVPARALPLLVVGAHMTGMPLNDELTARGGRFVRAVETAERYRLLVLETVPPKPGLVPAAPDDGGAVRVAGELWALPPAALASLLAALPSPMALGRVTLADGAEVTGFLCAPSATVGAREISAFGDWRSFLETTEGRPAGRPSAHLTGDAQPPAT